MDILSSLFHHMLGNLWMAMVYEDPRWKEGESTRPDSLQWHLQYFLLLPSLHCRKIQVTN